MRTKTKHGFTLVELIVVMAIFSILLLGAMMITQPVSRMYRNTALSEKTYSYANNIQIYLQGRLEYAEDLEVATTDKLDINGDHTFDDVDLATWAENFRKAHWDATVGYNGKEVVPLKGKIHILRLLNSADNGITDGYQGQIVERVYDFKSDTPIQTTVTPPAWTAQLNNTLFTASDSAYNFSYALGASKFVSVSTPPGGLSGNGETYRALDKDFNNSGTGISATELAVSIVLDKKTGGSIDVAANAADGSAYSYRAFTDPCAIQIATLPLTNINDKNRNGVGIRRPYKDASDVVQQYQYAGDTPQFGSGKAFSIRANDKIDFSNDIYFIYAYTDEIVNSK